MKKKNFKPVSIQVFIHFFKVLTLFVINHIYTIIEEGLKHIQLFLLFIEKHYFCLQKLKLIYKKTVLLLFLTDNLINLFVKFKLC